MGIFDLAQAIAEKLHKTGRRNIADVTGCDDAEIAKTQPKSTNSCEFRDERNT
jgi:hypothetical protein